MDGASLIVRMTMPQLYHLWSRRRSTSKPLRAALKVKIRPFGSGILNLLVSGRRSSWIAFPSGTTLICNSMWGRLMRGCTIAYKLLYRLSRAAIRDVAKQFISH